MLDLVHRGALEPVRQLAAFASLQTHACTSTQLKGAHRRDVDEQEAARDFRGEFGRGGRSVVVVRVQVGHHCEGITRDEHPGAPDGATRCCV